MVRQLTEQLLAASVHAGSTLGPTSSTHTAHYQPHVEDPNQRVASICLAALVDVTKDMAEGVARGTVRASTTSVLTMALESLVEMKATTRTTTGFRPTGDEKEAGRGLGLPGGTSAMNATGLLAWQAAMRGKDGTGTGTGTGGKVHLADVALPCLSLLASPVLDPPLRRAAARAVRQVLTGTEDDP